LSLRALWAGSLLLLAACYAPAVAEPEAAPAGNSNTASLAALGAGTSEPTAAAALPQAPRGHHPADWREYPVVPEITETAIQIYLRGIANGNDPQRFSKIGDCQNITTYFLAPYEDPRFFALGEEYAYLQETIDWYYG